jgi:FkbM family methyltransferase
MRARSAARTALRALGMESPALAVRRRFLPGHVRRDIRDHELLVALLERELEPASDCLDAGAHEGSVLAELVRLAPAGRHLAWEPLPEQARRLRERFPGVEVREAALSDRPGERDFAHVVDNPGWSGLRARPVPGGGRVQTLRVRCERLDDAVPSGAEPALLKVDVEGAELELLEGARATLRRHRPLVVFEHGRGSADHYGTTPQRIHGLLAGELGYSIEGLDGDGPYDARDLAAQFESGERVNFVARPGPLRA